MNYTDLDVNDKNYLRLKKLHEKCFIDLTGKKFGKLTVMGVDYQKGKTYYWKCKCDCGKETTVAGGALTSNHTRSCGCLHQGAMLKNLVGMKFNNLTVVEYSHKEGKTHYWKCVCDCGTEVVVRGEGLKQGTKKSCGCMRRGVKVDKRKHNLTNKKFGKLVAIYPSPHSCWHCICECGNEVDVKTGDLTRGFVTSCGCASLCVGGSQPEIEIKEYLIRLLNNPVIEKSRILDGKEIDIYLPEYHIGIEYNGSAFHASENGVYDNKDKYYHRDKFLMARNKGIHLITVFDKDYEENKEEVLNKIKSVINNSYKFIPKEIVVYTNNDYDDGIWLKEFGYKEEKQEEPDYFIYGSHKFLVYRCGKTKWIKDNSEIT